MEQQVFRKNNIENLKALVNKTEAKNIFLVRGKKSYHACGADLFIKQLIRNNHQLTIFDDFEPNPQLKDLKNGVSLYKHGNYNLVIAIGGGSVLDMAKLISIFAHQEDNFEDLVKGSKQFIKKNTSVLAIPTTSGSGAEATKFAVLYIDKTKYSVEIENMLPRHIYLSSQFSNTASPYLTACTGLDAFCQSVESVWSVNSNETSQSYALEAVKIVWQNLKDAVITGDTTAKEKMQEAAHLAGKAINISKTTASHALSYAFTSYYGIPHGHAVALSLPFFLEYNYGVNLTDCNDSRGADAVKSRINRLLNELNLSVEEAPLAFEKFFDSLDINIKIKKLIKEFDQSLILQNINFQRLKNNPRIVSSEVINQFLSQE